MPPRKFEYMSLRYCFTETANRASTTASTKKKGSRYPVFFFSKTSIESPVFSGHAKKHKKKKKNRENNRATARESWGERCQCLKSELVKVRWFSRTRFAIHVGSVACDNNIRRYHQSYTRARNASGTACANFVAASCVTASQSSIARLQPPPPLPVVSFVERELSCGASVPRLHRTTPWQRMQRVMQAGSNDCRSWQNLAPVPSQRWSRYIWRSRIERFPKYRGKNIPWNNSQYTSTLVFRELPPNSAGPDTDSARLAVQKLNLEKFKS